MPNLHSSVRQCLHCGWIVAADLEQRCDECVGVRCCVHCAVVPATDKDMRCCSRKCAGAFDARQRDREDAIAAQRYERVFFGESK